MKTNLISNKTAISTVVIAIVAIVVVAVVAGGIYFATTQNKPSSPSASESPTPSAAVSQSPTPIATASTAPTVTLSSNPTTGPSTSTVADASSLQYSVNLSADTPSALRGTYTYYGKNVGTSSFMLLIEFTDLSNYQTIIILNGDQQKSWEYSSGQWSEIQAYGTYHAVWQGYVGVLASWNGIGDYSYTLGRATVRIYDISVNPVLADSLFQHS
jgi:hypothetical protein